MPENFKKTQQPVNGWEAKARARPLPAQPQPPVVIVHSKDEPVTQEQLAESYDRMVQHVDARFDQFEALFRDGFPDGDLAGHRAAHEGVIKQAADRAAMWKSVRERTVSGVVWAFVLLTGSALWEHAKNAILSSAK